MKWLVACEESGAVREALRRRGHDATSCDLLPSALPGPHIEGDVREINLAAYDGVIAFPPCTYLTVIDRWYRFLGWYTKTLIEKEMERE